MDYIKYVIKNW